MIVAIYPGSFDPLTVGHLDIINRAASFCDTLIVAIAKNSSKMPLFTVDERLVMIKDSFRDNGRIEALAFDGLLADFCKGRSVSLIIRGIRGHSDFDYESSLAFMNEHLAPEVQTVFLLAKPGYSNVSSSLIREAASYNGDISSLVPAHIIPQIKKKFSVSNR